MANLKLLGAAFATAILGTLSLAGLGYQMPTENRSAKDKPNDEKAAYESALANFNSYVQEHKLYPAATAYLKAFTAGSSPLRVRGGSIHAEDPGDLTNTWTEYDEFYDYSAPSPDNNYIILKGFTKKSTNVPAPSPISNTTGWKIEISNQDAGSHMKPEAVLVCSDENCDGNSIDPDKLVYFQTSSSRNDVKLEHIYAHSEKQDELRFHDTSEGCDDYPNSSSESKVCDIPRDITITISDAQHHANQTTYECKKLGDDNCVITIGKK